MKKLACALTAIVGIFGSLSGSRAEMPKMIFGTGVDPGFATAYVAKAAGLFEKNGLDVQLNTGPSGSAMVAYLVKNQSQAALAGEQAGIQAFNLDRNVVLAAATATADTWWGVVARDVPSLDGLKGKRIGVSLGSGSEVFWQAIVEKFRLDPKDYKLINVDPPEMVAALERGNIDAFVAWEPWLTRAKKSVANTDILLTNAGIMLPRAILYVNREWAEANPAAASAFMLSLVQANDLIHSNRVAAADYVASFLKLDPAETQAFMMKLTYEVRLDQATIDQMKSIEVQLKKSGKLAKPVDWGGFVYQDLLKRVLPSKVSLPN